MRNSVGSFITCVLFLVSPALVAAQTSLSATSTCGIAGVHQTVEVGDEGQHSISLDQRRCRWTKPLELAGSESIEYVASGVDDVQFDKSKDVGYSVGRTANGDKYFIRYEGRSTLKGGVPLQLVGVWKFTGGTGKLRGLTGHGTYTAQPDSAGEMAFIVKGEYRVLPKQR